MGIRFTFQPADGVDGILHPFPADPRTRNSFAKRMRSARPALKDHLLLITSFKCFAQASAELFFP
jgi:hypothetical protein